MLLKIPKIYKPCLVWGLASGCVIALAVFLDTRLLHFMLELNEKLAFLSRHAQVTPADSQTILTRIKKIKKFEANFKNSELIDEGPGKNDSRLYNLIWRGNRVSEFNQIFDSLTSQGLIKILAFRVSRPHKLKQDYLYNMALGQAEPIFRGTIRFVVYNYTGSGSGK